MTLDHGLLEEAERLEAFGAGGVAQAVREAVGRLEAALAAWWNAPLTVAEARAWGGYSEQHLRRLIREGTLPVTPDGRLRRRDVPVQPGHPLPLGLEPGAVAREDWNAQLLERRQQRSVS